MSALCEQGMIYLHTHIYIYIDIFFSGHRRFLEVAGGLKSAGREPHPVPRFYQWGLSVHAHDQYYIYVSACVSKA